MTGEPILKWPERPSMVGLSLLILLSNVYAYCAVALDKDLNSSDYSWEECIFLIPLPM